MGKVGEAEKTTGTGKGGGNSGFGEVAAAVEKSGGYGDEGGTMDLGTAEVDNSRGAKGSSKGADGGAMSGEDVSRLKDRTEAFKKKGGDESMF